MSTPGFIHAYVLDGRGGARPLTWDELERWTPADGILWANLDYSSPEVIDWLRARSQIDAIAISALTDLDPRPRVLPVADALLLIVRGINNNAGAEPEDMISVRAWIDSHRIITLRHRASTSLKSVAAELERGSGPRSVGDLALLVVGRMVEHAVERVDTIGDRVAACEDRVLADQRDGLRAELADLRRRTIALRRFLAPQREALAKLAHNTTAPWLTSEHRARFAEAADHMTRTVEELDAARDRAAVTQEELGSRVAEAANQRLYLLSIFTAIFLPLGFVCALLGVNVGGVPLQRSDWAFWALCGLFLVGVGVQLWLFRRRGWL